MSAAVSAAATWLPAWAHALGLRSAHGTCYIADVQVRGAAGRCPLWVTLDVADRGGRRFLVYVRRATDPALPHDDRVGIAFRVTDSPWAATDSEPAARLALDLALGWAQAKMAAQPAPIPVSGFDVASVLADALWGLGTAEVRLPEGRCATLGDVALTDAGLVLTVEGQTFQVTAWRTF